MDRCFETSYDALLEKVDQIDPMAYGQTRNFIDGAVTCLSPYISRGVISTQQVLQQVLAKGYELSQIESFVKELCWRDYFQRVWQVKDIHVDIKWPQQPVLHTQLPMAIVQANTGIVAIDQAIQQLYSSGYMHNHCRMYTASVVCNIAQAHWLHPAQWMYYHLLDGDWASNACSWQWVAGANSSKKYIANQENINKYTYTNQSDTFLDTSYENLTKMEVPIHLLAAQTVQLETNLPKGDTMQINKSLPTFVYNYYNLDPLWHMDKTGNRILLLEPDFFSAYPVSNRCIDFMLALGKNIPELQVYVGSFDTFCAQYDVNTLYYKEHPLNTHYRGIKDSRDWMIESVCGYYPSFFSYWKKIQTPLMLQYS